MVYLITNLVNDKYYVGKTVKSLNRRWSAHKKRAKTNPKSYIHNAIKRYGEENFDIQVLSKESDETKCINLEKVWIILLQSKSEDYGYNLTSGGDGMVGCRYSIEYKKDISERVKNLWKNPEYVKNICASRKGRIPWNKGKILETSPWNKGKFKTNCIKGHLLTENNFVGKSRNCSICNRERQRIKSGYYNRHPHENNN